MHKGGNAMRILVMSDSPFIPTGLAKVGREIALGLYRHGHDVGYLEWFHHGDIPQKNLENIRCWLTNDNSYGANHLDKIVNRFQPEVVLTIGDMWNLWYLADGSMCRTRRWFQWVAYIPVDGEPINGGIPPSQLPILEDVDWPVAYTKYAEAALRKSVRDQEFLTRLRTIYHGVNHNLFKPTDPEFRKKLRHRFGIGDEKFIFLTVSRNQSRKNIPELLRAWKIFSETQEARGRVLLWPHMFFNDPMGWKIDNLLDILQLRNNSIMYYNQVAHAEHEMLLIPEEETAALYQIADAFILIAGEGFGLPTFEAMATKLPCVLLDYAASTELGAEGRAEMIPCKDFATWTGMQLTQRPMPDPAAVARAMMKVYSDRDWRRFIAENGYKFCLDYSWEKVVADFNALMMEIEVPFLRPKALEVVA